MSGLRRTSAIALAGGILLLTGCQDSAGASSADGTPASSGSASARAAAPTAPSDAPAASPSSSPAGTGAPTPGSATGSTGPGTGSGSAGPATGGAPSPAGHPPTTAAGCRNLTAGDAVKAEVTQAYRHDVTRFEHIGPVPHVFFYGRCGTVRYAATRFQPLAGATQAELVGMQDEGSVTKYFRDSGGGWAYIASDGLPAGPHGCGDIPAIPHALSTAWGNCSIAP